MKIQINPGTARGRVTAPPSKSMAHRMMICAGLAAGTSVLQGISDSQDMQATLDCLAALGAQWQKDGETVTITGIGSARTADDASACDDIRMGSSARTAVHDDAGAAGTQTGEPVLRCRESGSTLRFFIPICLQTGRRTQMVGAPRLMERPLQVYAQLCRERGLLFAQEGQTLTVQGPLPAGSYRLRGDISSQFISGLLFALPLCEGDSTVTILPPIESRPYIDMTLAALKTFGVRAAWQDAQTLYIPGGQQYHACDAQVEGDFSNAAFFGILDAIRPENQVQIDDLPPAADSLQADRVYPALLARLDTPAPCIDLTDCPDLGPILFAAAAAKHGGRFVGTKRLKIKESDRGAAMAAELCKCGVSVTVGEDEILVEPSASGLQAPTVPLSGHNDHRIVMSAAVLLTLTGGVIEGAEAVSKSFPDFFDKLQALGIEVKNIEN